MTPEQKAYLLVSKFQTYCETRKTIMGKDYNAKQCALICIDEMITQNDRYYLLNGGALTNDIYINENDFLIKVKQEINKL